MRGRKDLAHGVRGGAAALPRFTFRDRGGEQQTRAGQHTHEDLQQHKALVQPADPQTGPAPWTVCQMVTADAPSTTNAVNGCPARTAAAITNGKTTYSRG